MKLFRTKKWHWLDIGLLKGSCVLFGMLVGAYFADFVVSSAWMILMTAIALAIKPAIAYLANSEDE